MATTTAPDDGGAGHDDRAVEQAGQDLGRDDAERGAEHAAGQAEHGGLDQELPADGPRRGAERLAQPDLAGPLGDRDEHDVHDADAADQQRQGRDAGEQDRQRLVDRGRRRHERVLAVDREVGARRRR